MTEEEKLADQYDTADGWGEHPVHTMSDWKREFCEGYTRQGYWSWVIAQIEEDEPIPWSEHEPIVVTKEQVAEARADAQARLIAAHAKMRDQMLAQSGDPQVTPRYLREIDDALADSLADLSRVFPRDR